MPDNSVEREALLAIRSVLVDLLSENAHILVGGEAFAKDSLLRIHEAFRPILLTETARLMSDLAPATAAPVAGPVMTAGEAVRVNFCSTCGKDVRGLRDVDGIHTCHNPRDAR